MRYAHLAVVSRISTVLCLAGALVVAFPWRPACADEQITPLLLEKRIPLPNVGGRIDHMAIDLARKRLIVAELGNGTVDIVDLATDRVLHRITGIGEPQGVAYAEKGDLVAVASAADGSVRLFRASDFGLIGSLGLGRDADNLRIDPRNGNIVAGFGEGGLAIIDPVHHNVIATVTLHGHPEGFQIEPTRGGRAFVNVPDAGEIAVVDLDARKQIAAWRADGLAGNFPMALDPATHTVAVVFRTSRTLALLDTNTGEVKTKLSICGDADDVFFDARRQQFYISCGSGEVDTVKNENGSYRKLAPLATVSGARTSLFVPEFDRLFVAQRAGLLASDAAIEVCRPSP